MQFHCFISCKIYNGKSRSDWETTWPHKPPWVVLAHFVIFPCVPNSQWVTPMPAPPTQDVSGWIAEMSFVLLLQPSLTLSFEQAAQRDFRNLVFTWLYYDLFKLIGGQDVRCRYVPLSFIPVSTHSNEQICKTFPLWSLFRFLGPHFETRAVESEGISWLVG